MKIGSHVRLNLAHPLIAIKSKDPTMIGAVVDKAGPMVLVWWPLEGEDEMAYHYTDELVLVTRRAAE